MTFTSRDTSTATVSGNTLTWRHGGTILVTATVNGFTSAAVSISAAYAPESIKVTDDSGQPVDAVTLRVGESRNLKVTVLPDAASQEFTASAANEPGHEVTGTSYTYPMPLAGFAPHAEIAELRWAEPVPYSEGFAPLLSTRVFPALG